MTIVKKNLIGFVLFIVAILFSLAISLMHEAYSIKRKLKNHRNAGVMVVHNINRQVWLPNPINGTFSEVNIYFGPHSDYLRCEPLQKYASKHFINEENITFDFGQACTQNFVLNGIFIPKSELKETLKYFYEFIAAHEAFHFSVQYLDIPYRQTTYNDTIKLTKNHYAYLNGAFERLLNSEISSQIACKQIDLLKSELGNSLFYQLIAFQNLEWVAEDYSRRVVFKSDVDKYKKFRTSLTSAIEKFTNYPKITGFDSQKETEKLYTSHYEVIKFIEQTYETHTWQQQVADGTPLVDIFLRLKGCPTITDDWVQFNITEFNRID